MYYLLLLSVFAASFNSIVVNKAQIKEKRDVLMFSFIGTIIWCVILFVINGASVRFTPQIVFWGTLYGLVQSFFILFKTSAMSNGSVSVTTLIGNCSLLISIFVSWILWKEKITLIDIVGLGLLVVSIFMCTYKKSKGQYTSKWKYYALFFLFFAALVGIVFKAFGKNVSLEYCGDMMFVAASVMAICYFISAMFCGGIKTSTDKNHFVLYAILCGILSCVYNRLNIFLAGAIDAIVFFPAFNGGVILLSAILGMIICKEKLIPVQKLGILIGIVAICIIGIL